MELFRTVAPDMSLYLEISRLTGDEYRANKKNIQRSIYKTVEHNRLLKKFNNKTSICYAAMSSKADLNAINPEDCLYIGTGMGCQRYWRGKGLNGEKFNATNFHHTQMRKGRNENNIETYLEKGNSISIYVITGDQIKRLAAQNKLNVRLHLARSIRGTPHYGNVLENEILAEGVHSWSWNTRAAEKQYQSSVV